MPKMKQRGIDRVTRQWIRCPADERAARNGCRFDEERADFVVNWIQIYCHLYEGEYAGQLMELHDWQDEVTRRLFGWVMFSEDWDRWVRRFRRAGLWFPKKQKKSPTLASYGCFLLCGDGEQGQKVYSVAKDGKQAMISHLHAIEMIRRSPELSQECEINKSTGQITHLPTSSFYKIVAGDNPKSQEGLNGSVLVDETHVVDRRLMKILRGAGISRTEPLHIEVSTAGNNPDGYGKEQFDLGRRIAAAEPGYEDDQVMFVEYSAPQDLSDADLDADPVKYGKMANPSWGHTIKPGEFLRDYRSARTSLSDLLDFKMYRLNIWQQAANPWLNAGDWARCKQRYTEDDLAGASCFAGLDLSKTQDMSALVLAFPLREAEAFRLLAYFWLPEVMARAKAHLAPFLDWAAKDHLQLTPGNVIDYGWIRAQFRKLAKRFRILGLAYDPRYADDTTQSLEQGVLDDAGKVIEEGTGVPRVAFDQNLGTYAEPSKDFERKIIAGLLAHNGHPVLDWQVGHVKVKTDPNGHIMPVKPSRDDVKKIDGIQAAIMALALAKKSGNVNWYRKGCLSA